MFGFKLILVGTLPMKLQPKKVPCLHFTTQLHFLLKLVASLSFASNHADEVALSCQFLELLMIIPFPHCCSLASQAPPLPLNLSCFSSNCEVLLMVFCVKDERLIGKLWGFSAVAEDR